MTNYPITGIDVSHEQGQIDWSRALSQGIAFAFIKASEGAQVIDDQFERNMRETARLGLACGIYHSFRPDEDWKKQSEQFASIVNTWDFRLEPVIALVTDADLTKNALNNICAKFFPHVEAAIGRKVMIYTSSDFFDRQLPLTNWAWRCPLWVAHSSAAPQPKLPLEWSNHKKSWDYWQHATVENDLALQHGVTANNVNLNRFNGTSEKFMKRYKITTLPAPPPIPGSNPIQT